MAGAGATGASGARPRDSVARRLLGLSRPRFWLYLGGPALVGLVYAAPAPAALSTPAALAAVAYFLVPANVFLYGVNDVFDADIDRRNPKKGAEGREVQYRPDRRVTAAIAVAGLAGLALAAALPRPAGLATLAFLALSVAYSAPPIRFKTTPLLDSLSNGLYVLPAVVTYEAVAGTHPPLLAVLGGWLWTMAMHTFSAIPDVEPDRAAGVRTTATVLGASGALSYCGAAWLAAAVAMAAHHPALGALFGVYPALVAGIAVADVPLERAYWWFPVVNAVAGATLTVGGLWMVVGGG